MNCANCKMQPKNRCGKEGFDCTGGKEDSLECQLKENVPWQNISEGLRSLHGDTLCRLEEIIEFAKKAGFKKLGIAFCIGLADEAAVVAGILHQVFTVESVCCKVGGMDKDKHGMSKIKPDAFKVACNPVAQAKILNRAGVDLNIQLGLCLGHDLLFQKYTTAPITVLAVKDRALGNNPLAAVQCTAAIGARNFRTNGAAAERPRNCPAGGALPPPCCFPPHLSCASACPLRMTVLCWGRFFRSPSFLAAEQ